ncbi:MAG TPA: sialidase family protein [Planctomycetota bacterium]
MKRRVLAAMPAALCLLAPCVLARRAASQQPPATPLAATVVAAGGTQPHLAAGADGRFYAVFLRNGNIELAVSSDRGATFGSPVTAIDAKGNARGGMQRGPRVAVDGADTIYVTAPLCFDKDELGKRYPTNDLYLAVSTDGGVTFGPPARINDAPKQAPEALHCLAAAPGGEVFVAWLDQRQRKDRGQDLGYATVGERGKKIGANVVLEGPLCECCAPGLAMDPKGNPILVWREGSDRKNRALWIATSSDGGATFAPPKRLNHGDSRVDG